MSVSEDHIVWKVEDIIVSEVQAAIKVEDTNISDNHAVSIFRAA
jgi:hypothetical protein